MPWHRPNGFGNFRLASEAQKYAVRGTVMTMMMAMMMMVIMLMTIMVMAGVMVMRRRVVVFNLAYWGPRQELDACGGDVH